MPSVRSHFALAALASPLATGCFLSGDYKLGEQSVAVSTSEHTESPDATTSEEPTPPAPPPVTPVSPPPTPTTSPTTTSDTTSSVEVETSSAATATSEPTVDVPTSAATSSSSESTTSEPASSAPPTSSDVPSSDSSEPTTTTNDSSNGWWNSSDDCWRNGQQGCGGFEECTNDEVQGPGGRCYWFGALTLKGNWNSAVSTCTARGEGWTPISMRDQAEQGFLSARLHDGDDDKTWLNAQYSGGKWRWLDDEEVFWNGTGPASTAAGAYDFWGSDEPSGKAAENCLRAETFNGQFGWGDSDCATTTHLIACQGPLP